MKILWLVNIIMPDLAKHLKLNTSVFGGWLTGALHAIKGSGNELVICTTSENEKLFGKYELDGVTYYVTKRTDVETMKTAFSEILKAENPDVIHLYGTEFAHTWAMASVSEPQKTLVTVQGLVTFISQHVFGGVPYNIVKDTFLHRLLRKLKKGGDSIELKKNSYLERSVFEVNTMKRVRYVNGGTAWGDGCAKLLQPEVNILPCELILRDSFYGSEKWNYDKCEKHSVFTVSTYSIKGLDMLLQAMKYVVEQFPDTKVYVAGQKCIFRHYTGLKRWVLNHAPDYDYYIQSLIEENGLTDNIIFLGYLDEQEMLERARKSNVFVSCSAIENHSTALGEAMISGVPSIASCVGGLQEMIDHGKDGFLYPFNEYYMLAYYICRIFKDRELAEQFSKKGIEHASRTFNREENCKQLLNMYKTIYENNEVK